LRFESFTIPIIIHHPSSILHHLFGFPSCLIIPVSLFVPSSFCAGFWFERSKFVEMIENEFEIRKTTRTVARKTKNQRAAADTEKTTKREKKMCRYMEQFILKKRV
jgi:hypothetical protein